MICKTKLMAGGRRTARHEGRAVSVGAAMANYIKKHLGLNKRRVIAGGGKRKNQNR